MAALLTAVGLGSCLRVSPQPKQLPPVSGPPPPPAVLLTTAAEDDPWWRVVEAIRESGSIRQVLRFDADSPETILPEVRALDPTFAVLVMPPEEIDVNFAWRWLATASRLDDDPFVDLCYGVITGATPEDAVAFWRRIRDAERDPSTIAPRLLDCLGPNQLDNDRAIVHRQLFWAGWLRGKIDARGMNNGLRGFADGDLDKLTGYGILHFGGHGYPDRIDQGLTAAQLARAQLSPGVVFNGACSTGVTSRAFERGNGVWTERRYAPEETFCLTMLKQPVVAYLAATHPDHGVPVYQEMEHWLTTGCTLGETIKRTYDQVVVANGGRALEFPVLADGQPLPNWGPKEIMLYGTASRLLFGDPRLRPGGPVHSPPVAVSPPQSVGGALRATLTVASPDVPFSLMDTFHPDMGAQPNGFNDRVYAQIPLDGPVRIEQVSARATAGGTEVQSRVVGYAVEEWGGGRRLHVQVDLPSTGYQQGRIRREGATVEVSLQPAARARRPSPPSP
jgi:hypothetical protein